ncbi:MAG: septum formation protein Maf [Anaerolineae bacterium]|nr:septum formation protein Maf [Anaerolineae bacterium]
MRLVIKKESHLILLASQSPRRRELLSCTGLGFDVTSADVDESILPDEKPADYVLRLAESKARASARDAEDAQVVIGSDTAVVDADQILGKPRDAREAKAMLRQLRGRTHQVYTAIAIFRPDDGMLETDLCISDVPMREYNDTEMDTYIQSGDPLDKAGGYAIQHAGFHPVESFSGCFASVMGLPICHTARALEKAGVTVSADMPQLCQSSLNYDCTISTAVLRGENLG